MAKYKNMKNLAKMVVANFMRKEAENELIKLNKKPNNIFTLVKFMKKDGKDIEGGRRMRGKDVKLGFSEKGGKRMWKSHMEEVMNKEDDWDHMTEATILKGPVEKVTCKDMALEV